MASTKKTTKLTNPRQIRARVAISLTSALHDDAVIQLIEVDLINLYYFFLFPLVLLIARFLSFFLIFVLRFSEFASFTAFLFALRSAL